MKLKFTFLFFFSILVVALQAQSTTAKVYTILQENCTNSGCHTSANPSGDLDLVGLGANTSAMVNDVYNNLFEENTSNAFANSNGYKRVYPGRLDKSYFYRLLTPGFDDYIQLDAAEEGTVHPSMNPDLDDTEKELIRQWILFGAPANEDIVDENLIDDYYNTNGLASFPDGPPAPPAVEEGFQIRMGPFFLKPAGQVGDELEFFQKYELEMDDDVDVNRVDMKISNYSHHLIIYNFESEFGANLVPHGLRTNANHFDIGLVTAIQEATDLKLPEGTAFQWDNDMILDLNTHYINYSATNTYKSEAYINIYTQESGSADHQMYSELLVNTDIWIPNNGNTIEETQAETDNLGEIFVWGIMGHTHKYGTGYQVFKRLSNGQPGEIIYDGSCPMGVPDCVVPNYDYQHIPIRYLEPFMPITMNSSNGIIHKATWENNGPSSVGFGVTSDDEMMVLVVMFTTDTTGIIFTDTEQVFNPLEAVKVYPNPMENLTTLELPADAGEVTFSVYDMYGREVRRIEKIREQFIIFEKNNLASGMYIYRIEDKNNQVQTGKLLIK